MERSRAEKAEAERALTQLKASTELDPQRSDLSGHPQFQRVSFLFMCSVCERFLVLFGYEHFVSPVYSLPHYFVSCSDGLVIRLANWLEMQQSISLPVVLSIVMRRWSVKQGYCRRSYPRQ